MKLLLDNAWQTRVTRIDMDLILHVYAKRSKKVVPDLHTSHEKPTVVEWRRY